MMNEACILCTEWLPGSSGRSHLMPMTQVCLEHVVYMAFLPAPEYAGSNARTEHQLH